MTTLLLTQCLMIVDAIIGDLLRYIVPWLRYYSWHCHYSDGCYCWAVTLMTRCHWYGEHCYPIVIVDRLLLQGIDWRWCRVYCVTDIPILCYCWRQAGLAVLLLLLPALLSALSLLSAASCWVLLHACCCWVFLFCLPLLLQHAPCTAPLTFCSALMLLWHLLLPLPALAPLLSACCYACYGCWSAGLRRTRTRAGTGAHACLKRAGTLAHAVTQLTRANMRRTVRPSARAHYHLRARVCS